MNNLTSKQINELREFWSRSAGAHTPRHEILSRGTPVTVNGNRNGRIVSYDIELDMYEVRMWDGNRHVGDVIVPRERIVI